MLVSRSNSDLPTYHLSLLVVFLLEVWDGGGGVEEFKLCTDPGI